VSCASDDSGTRHPRKQADPGPTVRRYRCRRGIPSRRPGSVKLRGCDVATMESVLISEYRLYYDLTEFLGQLGLLPEQAS
jgi:hypothetical protein